MFNIYHIIPYIKNFLLMWIGQMNHKHIPLNSEVIMDQEQNLAVKMNVSYSQAYMHGLQNLTREII